MSPSARIRSAQPSHRIASSSPGTNLVAPGSSHEEHRPPFSGSVRPISNAVAQARNSGGVTRAAPPFYSPVTILSSILFCPIYYVQTEKVAAVWQQ